MRNLKDNKYAKRLIEEWQQHGKVIIASDWDDTLRTWRLNSQEECNKVIKLLKLCKEVGAYIVIFTACKEERYAEIQQYCKEVGLEIDAINQNPISLPYGNQNKIYANIFIDDRAGLEEALEILEFAMYTIRGQQHSVNEQSMF